VTGAMLSEDVANRLEVLGSDWIGWVVLMCPCSRLYVVMVVDPKVFPALTRVVAAVSVLCPTRARLYIDMAVTGASRHISHRHLRIECWSRRIAGGAFMRGAAAGQPRRKTIFGS